MDSGSVNATAKENVPAVPAVEPDWDPSGIRNEETLRSFLRSLLANPIARVDLPMIRWAREAASKNDSKGLVELDRVLSSALAAGPLREASLKAGQKQLHRLRPIQGHRFLARYIAEIESDRAEGFQPIVYGIHLFLFSVSLREGLMNYAFETVQGFATAASREIRLDEPQRRLLVEEVCANLPQLVEQSLAVERSALAAPADALASVR